MQAAWMGQQAALDDGETAYLRRSWTGTQDTKQSQRQDEQRASSRARCAAIGWQLQGSSGGTAEKLGYGPGCVRFPHLRNAEGTTATTTFKESLRQHSHKV